MPFNLKEIVSHWIGGFHSGDYEEWDVTLCNPPAPSLVLA
jgi:hypothetical protein